MTGRAESVLDLVGRTPVVRLRRLPDPSGAAVWAKLESQNPLGCVKERVALALVEDGERRGLLGPGGAVVEPTSGNTGVGLAMVCAVRGYRLALTMPETMSEERKALLRALGAELVLTPGREGMAGAVARAEALARERGAYLPQQFENPANPRAHRATTGPELWEQLGGRLDAFVAGVGTGGTVSGAGAALKERRPGIRVVAVEPAGSPVLSGGKAGRHAIQGIGAGFVPGVYDAGVVDEVRTVTDEEARDTARRLAREEGVLAGISSGAACHAALAVAAGMDRSASVAVLLPDTGERYLSTGLFGGEGGGKKSAEA